MSRTTSLKCISLTNSRYLSSRFISHPINTLPDNARCAAPTIRYPTTKHSVRYSKVKFVSQREAEEFTFARTPREQRSSLRVRDLLHLAKLFFFTFCNKRASGFRCRAGIYRRDIVDIPLCARNLFYFGKIIPGFFLSSLLSSFPPPPQTTALYYAPPGISRYRGRTLFQGEIDFWRISYNSGLWDIFNETGLWKSGLL